MGNGRLHRIVHHASEYVRIRLDLLRIDVEQERDRLTEIALRWMLTMFSLLMAAQLLAALLIILSWHTPWRLPVMFGLLVMLLLACAWQYRSLKDIRSGRLGEPGREPSSPPAVRGDEHAVP